MCRLGPETVATGVAHFSHRDQVMTRVLRDLRYAFRALVRTPGFTATVLVTIGIGTGANATVFSFVMPCCFGRLPVWRRHLRSWRCTRAITAAGLYGDTSYPDFESIRTGTHAFAQVAAADNGGVAALRVGDDVHRVSAAAAPAISSTCLVCRRAAAV